MNHKGHKKYKPYKPREPKAHVSASCGRTHRHWACYNLGCTCHCHIRVVQRKAA